MKALADVWAKKPRGSCWPPRGTADRTPARRAGRGPPAPAAGGTHRRRAGEVLGVGDPRLPAARRGEDPGRVPADGRQSRPARPWGERHEATPWGSPLMPCPICPAMSGTGSCWAWLPITSRCKVTGRSVEGSAPRTGLRGPDRRTRPRGSRSRRRAARVAERRNRDGRNHRPGPRPDRPRRAPAVEGCDRPVERPFRQQPGPGPDRRPGAGRGHPGRPRCLRAHRAAPVPARRCQPPEVAGPPLGHDGKTLFPHQQQAQAAAGHMLLRAPTGQGKTEAALLWASTQVEHLRESTGGMPRVFYTLPYLASINAMSDRLRKELDPAGQGLIGSRTPARRATTCNAQRTTTAARHMSTTRSCWPRGHPRRRA